MSFNKHKGFSLVEVIIVITVVSLVLAASAPILTKRMKNSQTSGCVGGSRSVKKIFIGDGTFTVPENIMGDVTFTMIGGGGGGGGAYDFTIGSQMNDGTKDPIGMTSIVSDDTCELPKPAENHAIFYADVLLNATASGKSASSNAPGASGEYIYNYRIDAQRNCSYTYDVTAGTLSKNCDGNKSNIPLSFTAGNAGESGVNGSRDYLSGGYPKPFIFHNGRTMGMGQGCVWDGTSCSPGVGATGGGCQITYRRAIAGAGGGAGAYAKFSMKLASDTKCAITIGRGGLGGIIRALNFNNAEGEYSISTDASYDMTVYGSSQKNYPSNGGDTTVKCGNGNTITAGGGSVGQVSLSDNNRASNLAIVASGGAGGECDNVSNCTEGQEGNTPLANESIAGGKGGSVFSYVDSNDSSKNIIFSQGAKGGCEGASSSYLCNNPQGQNGVSPSENLRRAGSGGGGASCSDNRCGGGGRGGDGVVIIEYKTKCY